MAAAYDDNFGFWEIDGQEEQAFLEHVQRQSVEKTCHRCDAALAHALENAVRLVRDSARMRAPTSMSQY